jgi:predicted dehydrogenase
MLKGPLKPTATRFHYPPTEGRSILDKGTTGGLSRRDLLKKTGQLAAAGALAGVTIPYVHAGESNTIQVALVGCGGRGTGAAGQALSTRLGPTKLVAMADVFHERLDGCYKELHKKWAAQLEVPADRKFIGFDAYRHAMDCLKPGDVVILATPPAFRWVHFTYALQKGLNVFMEKPISVDGPSTRKMLKLAEESEKRGTKVGVGLMCRHCVARRELYDRIRSGEIGELLLLRAYRMQGPVAMEFSLPKPDGISDLLYQIKRFHSFLWASGGCFSDFMIHNIDECCWMKDAWPVQAKAMGGRHYRGAFIDQNFDHYAVEYIFPDGARLLLEGRSMAGCHQEFASYAHGTHGSAVISTSGHTPAQCRVHKGQNLTQKLTKAARADLVWLARQPEPDPYQVEWDDLMAAIRQDKPYNEVRRGAEASLVTAMGRMAAHTGRLITRDDMLNCDHEFAPEVDKLTFASPAPLPAGPDGKYPVPQPGKGKREYYA